MGIFAFQPLGLLVGGAVDTEHNAWSGFDIACCGAPVVGHGTIGWAGGLVIDETDRRELVSKIAAMPEVIAEREHPPCEAGDRCSNHAHRLAGRASRDPCRRTSMILWQVGADQRVAGRLQIPARQDGKLSPDIWPGELIWTKTGLIKA